MLICIRDRFVTRLLLVVLLLASPVSLIPASELMFESPSDVLQADLATNTPIHLWTQTCFTLFPPVKANDEFHLDNGPMRGSQLRFVLLRLGDASQQLFSLPSFAELQALWRRDVYY